MEAHRAEQTGGEQNEHMDEARRLRRLQVMMSMVMSVISQDPDLTVEEAAEMAANARRAALTMFPDKELAYDIPLPAAPAATNERTLSAAVAIHRYARPANSRFSVETFTFSPSLMKRGTRISRPVSSLADLVTLPLDESPRSPGSV